MPKSPITRLFLALFVLAVIGPIVANIVNPTVAGQYNKALPALLAALLYKGPVYAMLIAVAVVVVARYVLGVTSLSFLHEQLKMLNNDSYAIILSATALITTIVLIVVLGG